MPYLLICTNLPLSCNECSAGRTVIIGKNEVMYKESGGLQPNDIKEMEDIELRECPAYAKPGREVDIKLGDCPAYLEQRKDLNIRLEECPAYGESKRGLNVSLDTCPAYEQIANLK